MDMQTSEIPLHHQERIDRFKTMTKSELVTWLSAEKEFWSKIYSYLKKTLNSDDNPDENRELVSQYLKAVDTAAQGLSDTRAIIAIQSTTPLPFHDESNFNPEKILGFAQRGQLSIALYIFETTLNTQHTEYLNSYTTDLKIIESSFKKYLESSEESFTTNLNEKAESYDNTLKQLVANVTNQLDERCEISVKKVENLSDSFSHEILAEEPVKYWKERETKHGEKAKIYLIIIAIAASIFIGLIVGLILLIHNKKETVQFGNIEISLPTDKYGLALLILITTSSIWLIRILVKLMMANLSLEIEALERSTMIKTFIAMEKSKVEQSNEIRMLFYSTLFKPTNNNLTDDSTSPEYIRLIEAMLQKK